MAYLDSSRITLPAGVYVVALSGGVDSVVLLDVLARHSKKSVLRVAHFNHGWSEASDEYERVAREHAERLGLPFHTEKQSVPRSEAAARGARYDFLRRIMGDVGADGIVTAHHADDLVETIILNVQRGTGRRGLTPFTQRNDIIRPLIEVPKSELIAYAQRHDLDWVEDVSNADTSLRRNAIRHNHLPSRPQGYTEQLRALRTEAVGINYRIDGRLAALVVLRNNQAYIRREELCQYSADVIAEIIVWMANAVQSGVELNRRTVEDLAVDIKTGRFNRKRNLISTLSAVPLRDTVAIVFNAL